MASVTFNDYIGLEKLCGEAPTNKLKNTVFHGVGSDLSVIDHRDGAAATGRGKNSGLRERFFFFLNINFISLLTTGYSSDHECHL